MDLAATTSSSPVPRLTRRVRIGLFVLAFGVRFAAILWTGLETSRFGDAPAYIFAAAEIVRTGHYPETTESLYFRAPGYPYFLAAATLGHPEKIARGKVANAVLGALAVLVLAVLSARIFRRLGVAIATGAAAALHPAFVYTATDIQSEPLFLLLLLASGYLLLAGTDRPSTSATLAAGGLLALAALTRPSALVIAPLLLAPLLDRRVPPRARAHLAGAAIAGFLFALAPWTARNALVFGELLPVNDAGGAAFYYGNSDWTGRFYGLQSLEEYRAWSRSLFADMERQKGEMTAAGHDTPGKRSREFRRRAIAERRAQPGTWPGLLLRKAWDWLRPYPHPLFWPPRVVVGVGALYAVLTAFAVAGLLRGERRGVVLFSLALLAITMAAHVIIIVVWRYRMSYWDPVLLLYGTHGAATLWTGWRRRP